MHWCRNVHNCIMPDKRQRLTFAFSILDLALQWSLHKCHWSCMQPRRVPVTVETSAVASSASAPVDSVSQQSRIDNEFGRRQTRLDAKCRTPDKCAANCKLLHARPWCSQHCRSAPNIDPRKPAAAKCFANFMGTRRTHFPFENATRREQTRHCAQLRSDVNPSSSTSNGRQLGWQYHKCGCSKPSGACSHHRNCHSGERSGARRQRNATLLPSHALPACWHIQLILQTLLLAAPFA